jgi:CheY-like chemotaxis protein
LLNPRKLLLVEDSEDDAFFLRLAFQKIGFTAPLDHVLDGQEAVDYISRTGKHAALIAAPPPRLVILDIKMPSLSGLEVLSFIRTQSQFPKLPVLIWTSSFLHRDHDRALALGATHYVVKPLGHEGFGAVARQIQEVWLALQMKESATASAAGIRSAERPTSRS